MNILILYTEDEKSLFERRLNENRRRNPIALQGLLVMYANRLSIN
jgi:hypothetical protein